MRHGGKGCCLLASRGGDNTVSIALIDELFWLKRKAFKYLLGQSVRHHNYSQEWDDMRLLLMVIRNHQMSVFESSLVEACSITPMLLRRSSLP